MNRAEQNKKKPAGYSRRPVKQQNLNRLVSCMPTHRVRKCRVLPLQFFLPP
jgi:hypothetical protein